jgi:secreted trypsin-like serine protease
MKRASFIILIAIITLPALSQKVTVNVKTTKNIAVSDWQILDDKYIPVFSGSEYFRDDSVSFSLEANKKYFMGVSVSDVKVPDSTIYCLSINGEPTLRITSDIGFGDHFIAFFTGVRQNQTKITGGTTASIADYPWQVFLESGDFTCGGSILSGEWIITAAHCTEDDFGNLIPASQMDVIVGADNPRSGTEGKKYFVSKVIRHEGFDHSTLNNDIALLQLTATINYENATPIRLVSKIDSASGATDPGVMSWVTGYGLTNVSPPIEPVTLQKVQLPVVSLAQASTVWPDIAPSDLMAGYRNGNKDACNGDSGGPLVVPVDNEYKLAGLVSWGSHSCDTYGAYTRVSMFESWINSKTGIEISYVPPVPSGDSIICKGTTTSQYTVGTIDGATFYDWQLLPAESGTIQGNSTQADVTWASGYTGSATIKLRVTKFNFVSYWSALTVHIAEYNKLISQSDDTVICAGQPVVLKVASEGYNLNYSWFRDGNFIKSGASAELPFQNATKDSTGVYRCDIAGSCGEDLSPEINLTVLPVTVISKITPDTSAVFGDDVTIRVIADGHNLLYQWQKDGDQIPDGNGPEYTLADVNAVNTGLYRVMVSGSCGEEMSNNVYVYVTNKVNHPDPEIFVWPTVVSSEFNIALSDERIYNLKLFNTAGKLIKEKLNCQYKTILNISNIPGGIYILTVYGSNFRKSVKLIRNR